MTRKIGRTMGQESEERVEQNAQSMSSQSGQAAASTPGEAASQGSEQQRAKPLVRISSPEQVDDYIRVTTPGMWLLVTAILVLLAAGIIWAYAVRLEMKTTNPDGTVSTEYVKPASFLTDGVTGN